MPSSMLGREQVPRLQEHQLLVEVAKGLFGLELQLSPFRAGGMALQGILDP
jgi:hypothetical protein